MLLDWLADSRELPGFCIPDQINKHNSRSVKTRLPAFLDDRYTSRVSPGFYRRLLAGTFVYGSRSCIIYRRFSRKNPKTRCPVTKTSTHTSGGIRMYASTTSLLLLLRRSTITKGKKERETERKRERGQSCALRSSNFLMHIVTRC